MTKDKKKVPSSFYVPPVVAVLGHVDHGKTTLLDTIRKTDVASREAGGITQRIGAYQISVPSKTSENKKITFIDTPGHEAFAKMRGRGAQVADIAILVVATNDGVMPQTIESIKHIKAAKLPFIVAATKIDLPETNLERLKKQLTKQEVKLEEYGGETPLVPVSSKSGKGIDKLLNMILLLAELSEVKTNGSNQFKGVIIESSLNKGKGPLATIIVKNGSLNKGDMVVTSEGIEAKIRAMLDEWGKEVITATIGMPVELMGLPKVPNVGSIVYKKEEEMIKVPQSQKIEIRPRMGELENLPAEKLDIKRLKIILKTDNIGSLEAIEESLKSRENVQIIASGSGNITESDVIMAKSIGAIIIGFSIKPPAQVLRLSQSEKVMVKTYSIIYEMIDEIDEVAKALQSGGLEEILGEAKILATFDFKDEKVAGIKVISGRIAKGDKVKIIRDKKEIGRARIKSLRHQKDDITKAEQGKEAGAILSPKLDFSINDSIIAIG